MRYSTWDQNLWVLLIQAQGNWARDVQEVPCPFFIMSNWISSSDSGFLESSGQNPSELNQWRSERSPHLRV